MQPSSLGFLCGFASLAKHRGSQPGSCISQFPIHGRRRLLTCLMHRRKLAMLRNRNMYNERDAAHEDVQNDLGSNSMFISSRSAAKLLAIPSASSAHVAVLCVHLALPCPTTPFFVCPWHR